MIKFIFIIQSGHLFFLTIYLSKNQPSINSLQMYKNLMYQVVILYDKIYSRTFFL